MLATIVATSGSTPASALSKMLVTRGGIASLGTVGGGCMEGDVLLHANRLYGSGKAEIVSFHLNEDDDEHGLVCGGSLDVLIEPIGKAQLSLIEKIRSFQNDGRDCIVATLLGRDGTILEKQFIDPTDLSTAAELIPRISTTRLRPEGSINPSGVPVPYPESEFNDLIRSAFRGLATKRIALSDGELLLEPVPGRPELIIFGGGHVSKFVSRIGSMAGFRITIIDDREKYANAERFPEAERTLILDFATAFTSIEVTSSTYLLVITRGHEYDQIVLGNALKTPAKYIGMIGSKRKVLKAFEKLVEKGMSAEDLKRVHAPVGIEIGAVTAEEIAVSIVAQLVNIRRGGSDLLHYKSDTMKEFFWEKSPTIA